MDINMQCSLRQSDVIPFPNRRQMKNVFNLLQRSSLNTAAR